MSDKGYAIFVGASKYVLINILATIVWVAIAQAGWLYYEDAIVLFYLIINCTAILMGRMQKILDKLNEIEKIQENG